MIYKAKEGSKAYEYIKSVCEAEDKELEAYFKRCKEAVGFEFKQFGGYTPDSTMIRICKIESILVDKETWERLDKKLWKKEDVSHDYIRIVLVRRTKQGKAIGAVLSSYNAVTNYRKILEQLGLREGNNIRFALPQLRYSQGHCFIRLDDNIRADKENPDLVEITMSEYERLIEKE